MTRRTRRDVLEALSRAGRAHSTAAVMFHAAVAAKQGLGATETKTLDLLERFGPLTAGDLGARAGLAPASVTGLVDRLEAKGFARRIKDPADGRRVLVELDTSNLHRFAPSFVDFMQRMDAVYARFTVDELDAIERFLVATTEAQSAATAALTAVP